MKIKSAKSWVAVDTETTGLSPWKGDRPFVVSWCWNNGDTGYVRWKVNPFTREVTPDPKDLKMLRGFISNPDIPKVFHNAMFDLRMLEMIGVPVKGRVDDTMFALRVLENDLMTYGLKPVCERLFGISDDDQQALKEEVRKARRIGKSKGYKLADAVEADYWLVQDPKYVVNYATLDVIRTARLWKLLKSLMDKSPEDMSIYQKEIDLMPVTYAMETRGVMINMDTLTREQEQAQKDYDDNYKKLVEFTGEKDLNLNSAPQMRKLFYDKLKIQPPTGKKFVTSSGLPKLDKKAIEVLLKKHKEECPALQWFANCKAASRGITMYQQYRDLAVRDEHGYYIVHPMFKQMGAATGRFSCANPNLQNVSTGNLVNAENSIHGRRPFCPRPGYAWYSFDYSQMEFYIFSNYSGDKHLINVVENHGDIHAVTANKIWGHGRDIVAEEKAKYGKSDTRTRGKMILFGILYGMGPATFADNIGESKAQAKIYLDEYFRSFPGIAAFMNKASTNGIAKGYVRNLYGRKYNVDAKSAYKVTNYLVQGSGADMTKEKLKETYEFLKASGRDAHIVLTVHDEIIFEIKASQADKAFLRKLKDIMENHHGRLERIKKMCVECKKVPVGGSWDKKESVPL